MLAGFLNSSLNLTRQTIVKDAVAGNRPTFATVSGMGAVPCAIAPASWKTNQDFQRDDSVVLFEIYTGIDITAQINDVLIIGAVKYIVQASQPYVNAAVGACYVTIVSKRNQ